MISEKERAALIKDLAGYDQVLQMLGDAIAQAIAENCPRCVVEELYERRALALETVKELERDLRH